MRIRTANELGLAARQRRRDLKLSQETVARRAGVTRQWLVRFEAGNAEVALSKAFAVLGALDMVVRADPAGTTSTALPAYDIPRIPHAELRIPEGSLTDMRNRIADARAQASTDD